MKSAKKQFRLVDSRGKILGKLHILDTLLISAVIFVAVIAIGQINQKGAHVVAEIKIAPEQWWADSYPPPYWLAFSIQKGDKALSWNGQTKAEVIDVTRYDTGYDRYFLYLKVKLASQFDEKKQRYTYDGRPLEVGNPIELPLSGTTVKGVILNIEGQTPKYPTVEKTITVSIRDQYPWFADAISVGDVMRDGNNVIATVVDKKVTYAEETTLMIDNNQTPITSTEAVRLPARNIRIAAQNPLKRDIALKLRVRVAKINDENYIFRNDQRVRIGNTLLVALTNITLSEAIVTAIE